MATGVLPTSKRATHTLATGTYTTSILTTSPGRIQSSYSRRHRHKYYKLERTRSKRRLDVGGDERNGGCREAGFESGFEEYNRYSQTCSPLKSMFTTFIHVVLTWHLPQS